MIISKFLDYGGSFLFNDENLFRNYFIQPLKHIDFLKNNKYKLIRFLSYISPWLIFPYTLFAYSIWLVVFIILFILGILLEIYEVLIEKKINKFKTFWNEL